MWDPSSLTRNQTCVIYIARQILGGPGKSPYITFLLLQLSFSLWLNNCLSFYLLDFLYTYYSLFSRASARNVSLLSIYSNTTGNLVISITSGNIPPEILCLSLLQSGPFILLSRDRPSFSSVGFLFLYNLPLSISLEQSILLFAFPFLVRGGCVHSKLLQSCLTPYDPMEPARLLWPWDSPGMNTAVGCQALLQGIFPIQGSNPHFLCLLRSLPLSHRGNPSMNIGVHTSFQIRVFVFFR